MTDNTTKTDASLGLNDHQVEESRRLHGDNVLTPPKRESLWKLYIDKYKDPIIQILLVAAIISLVLAFFENDFMETIGIIIAVILATTIGFYFERDAVKKFALLVQINEDQPVKVRRNGRVTTVPRRDIVVGDIILVETGDEIPADAKIISATNLQVNESSLTGEPLTSKRVAGDKDAQQPSHDGKPKAGSADAYPEDLILRSTMVMSGHAMARVIAVGDASEIGKVAQKASELTHTQTPLNQQLDRLAKQLRKKRFKNGAVKFDSEELHFDVDEKGHPVRCYFKRSKDANKLIEEFMLLANRTVAESIGKVKKGKKAKTLPYRIHDNPDPQKMETLREFIGKFGYKVKTEGTKGAIAKSINKLMDGCEGRPEQKLIQSIALRAMMKARYSVHNIGHFGLAFDYYTHFTSPIRRYPDTMVHRLITRYQQGGRSANEKHYEELCEHCSDMEQVAQNAERDSIKYKMVEFMGDKIGEVYDAHISGITSYGIYAEIDENHCEGMIPMRDLDDDYYEFDEKNFCLVGRRHHHKYQLGDAVRIRVAKANLEKKQLDFVLEK